MILVVQVIHLVLQLQLIMTIQMVKTLLTEIDVVGGSIELEHDAGSELLRFNDDDKIIVNSPGNIELEKLLMIFTLCWMELMVVGDNIITKILL